MRNLITGIFILVLGMLFSISKAQSCYELVWGDEFNYSGLPDSTKWSYEVGGSGWGNNELQYYTDKRMENARVENGNLVIEAREESYSGRNYTSVRLITYPGQNFWRYGKIEAKMKLPYGQGIWPAFWMLGKNIFEGTGWPACGEIDIMEMVGGGEGRDDKTYGTIHYADVNGNHSSFSGSYQLSEGIFADTFHIFSIEWTQTNIKWFVDGTQFYSASIAQSYLSEFHNEFFILLNVAVGGAWPGSPNSTTVFPQQMLVDYVRVYQLNDSAKITGDSAVLAAEKNIRYSTVESEDFLYSWSVPDDAVIVSGQGTYSILVDWGCDTGTVSCNLSSLCDEYLLKYKVELEKTSISGKEFIEENETNINYSVPLTRESSYTWMLPEGVVLNTKSDSNLINVDWNNSDGEIEVRVINYCTSDSASFEVKIVGQFPYPDPEQAHVIPGTIESINYDTGGEGFAYHDIDSDNQGSGSRQDEGVDTEANDGGENVGWIETGEWLEYTVNVENSNTYDIEIRIASPNSTGKFMLSFNGDDRTGNVLVPYTGAWSKFSSIILQDIQLYDTDTLMRVDIVNGAFNLGRLIFADEIISSTSPAESENIIMVYPTVASSELFVKNIHADYAYKILDYTGRILSEGVVSTQTSININNLKPGAYILVLSLNKSTITTNKFFKIN
jgi:beta-glucanase (GH16 family)